MSDKTAERTKPFTSKEYLESLRDAGPGDNRKDSDRLKAIFAPVKRVSAVKSPCLD